MQKSTPKWCQNGSKIGPTSTKNLCKNLSIFWYLLRSVFWWILVDSGSQNGAKLAPKSDPKLISLKTWKNKFGASRLVPNLVQIDQKSIKNVRGGDPFLFFVQFWPLRVDICRKACCFRNNKWSMLAMGPKSIKKVGRGPSLFFGSFWLLFQNGPKGAKMDPKKSKGALPTFLFDFGSFGNKKDDP